MHKIVVKMWKAVLCGRHVCHVNFEARSVNDK